MFPLVSKSIRRRADIDDAVPPDLRRRLRVWDVDYRLNIQNELRKRRHAIGPAEMRRLKDRIARRRLARARQRAAAKAAA